MMISEILGGPGEVRLINDLLENYNKYERPSEIDNKPLTVQFLITLQQIMDVDEKNQVIHTNLWLNMVCVATLYKILLYYVGALVFLLLESF